MHSSSQERPGKQLDTLVSGNDNNRMCFEHQKKCMQCLCIKQYLSAPAKLLISNMFDYIFLNENG